MAFYKKFGGKTFHKYGTYDVKSRALSDAKMLRTHSLARVLLGRCPVTNKKEWYVFVK